MTSSLYLLSSFAVHAAATSEADAERVRLSEDMARMAKRGNWRAVDKKYRQIAALRKVDIPFEDHMMGAQASFNLGDIASTRQRIVLALDVQENEEALQWLEGIDAAFVSIDISIDNSYDGDRELKMTELPFMPEEQDAYNRAKRMLADKGQFAGMLPVGEYSIGETAFLIAAGEEPGPVRIRNPGAGVSVGPRIDLGTAFAQAGEAQADSGLNAAEFGGVGTRVGVGVDLGFSPSLGLIVEGGYHNILAKGEEPEQLAKLYGYIATPTRYHAAFGWIALRYSTGSISAAAGPTFDFGKATVQGLDPKTAGAQYVGGTAAAFTPMEGSIRAGGVSAAFTYDLFDLGPMNGGISLLSGVQSDAARLYSWGQMAFTLLPQRSEL